MDKYVNGSGLKYFWDKIKDVFQPKGNYLAEESIFPWAKAQTKPTYTAAETGADPAGSANTALSNAKTYTDDTIRESDFATKQYVAQQVGQNVFKKQIVTSLPTTDIDQNTIYMILKADAAGNDNYNEYINLTGTSAGWEFLGNTNASLTDYYNKAEANNLFVLNANIDSALSTTSTNPVQNKVVTENINQINGSLGGCSFEQEGTDFYVTGADSVRKKLGSGGGTITIPQLLAEFSQNSTATTTLTSKFNVENFSTLTIGSVTANGQSGVNNYLRIQNQSGAYLYNSTRPSSKISVNISAATSITITTASYGDKPWVQINNLTIE